MRYTGRGKRRSRVLPVLTLAAMPSRKEWVDMVEYIHDRRRRYMPGRWKKEKSC